MQSENFAKRYGLVIATGLVVGAAAVAGVGLGIVRDLDAAAGLIPVERTHTPCPANRAAYDQNYQVFQKLYPSNRALFRALNGG